MTHKDGEHHRTEKIREFIVRIFTTLIGIVLFVYGLIAAFSPLPLGAPLVIIGLLMIAGANPAFRPVIRRMRKRWGWFDKLVRLVATRTGASVRSVIEETEPEEQDKPKDKDKDKTEDEADAEAEAEEKSEKT